MKRYTYRKGAVIAGQLLWIIIVLLFVPNWLSPLPDVLANVIILSLLGFAILFAIWQCAFSLFIDEKGLTVKRWRFSVLDISWSEIREVRSEKFLIFGIPRLVISFPPKKLYLSLKKTTKKFFFNPAIDNYEELLASIYSYTHTEPDQRMKRIIEKSKVRKLYRPLHRILGVLYVGLVVSLLFGFHRTIYFGGLDVFILLTYGAGVIFSAIQYSLVKRKTYIDAAYSLSTIILFFLILFHFSQMMFGGERIPIILLTIACAIFIFLALVSLSFPMNRKRWVFVSLLPILFITSTLLWYKQAVPRPTYKQIATLPGWAYNLSWSPNGELISAVTSKLEKEVERDITDQTLYTLIPAENKTFSVQKPKLRLYPIWSPDSSKLILTTYDKEKKITELLLYDSKLQNRTLIYRSPGVKGYRSSLYVHPTDCWSPDSRYLAYSIPLNNNYQIRLFDTLTNENKDLITLDSNFKIFWFSRNKLAYFTCEKVQKKRYRYTLWSIDIHSKKRQQIYTSKEFWPSYLLSPNKKYILVYAGRWDPESETYLIDLETKTKLTISLGALQISKKNINWDKDCNSLIFALKKDNKSKLYKFDITQNKLTELIEEIGEICKPRYSSSGERIAYQLGRKGLMTTGIFSIKSDGSDRQKVYSASLASMLMFLSDFANPWSPKEDTLVFPFCTFSKKDKSSKTIIYTASFKQ